MVLVSRCTISSYQKLKENQLCESDDYTFLQLLIVLLSWYRQLRNYNSPILSTTRSSWYIHKSHLLLLLCPLFNAYVLHMIIDNL